MRISLAISAVGLQAEAASWRDRVRQSWEDAGFPASSAPICHVWYDPGSGAFSPSIAANNAIAEALRGWPSIVVKTDVDCAYMPAFWRQVVGRLQQGHALCPLITYMDGDGVTALDTPAGPAGTLAMVAADWRRLRGYDERMYGHGHEDGDAICRAMDMRITVTRSTGLVRHLWHPERAGTDWYPYRGKENRGIRPAQGDWHAVAGKIWGDNDPKARAFGTTANKEHTV